MSRAIVFRSIVRVGALLAFFSVDAQAATLRVPGDFPTIQQAIDASTSGDVVLVAPGTYVEHLQVFDKGVFSLESEAGAASTIIDGGGAKYVIHASSPYRSRERLTRIAGFTIRHGQNGIFVHDGRADIENNIVTGIGENVRQIYRGAIHLFGATGTIRHNTVVRNATHGIDLRAPHDVVVEGNFVAQNAWSGILVESPYRPGSSVTILRNVIAGNTEHGVFLIGPLDVRLADNLVSRNEDDDSDSLYFNGASDGPITGIVDNNTVVAIKAPRPLVTFVGNVDGLRFANNVVYDEGDQAALNCGSFDSKPVLHHNDAFATTGAPVVGYCISQYAHGEGNVSVEPKFESDAKGARWQLAADSPLIDAGSNRAVGDLHHDLLGRPRIVDGGRGPVVDMGAYEYQPSLGEYTVDQLPNLPAVGFCAPSGINACGVAVGFCLAEVYRAAKWHDGVVEDITPVVTAQAIAINDEGEIVGNAGFPNHAGTTPIRWRVDGIVKKLDRIPPDSADARAINARGTAVGTVCKERVCFAALWKRQGLTALPTPEGHDESFANDINDQGQVVGFSRVDNRHHAVLWEHGIAKELDSPSGSSDCQAKAMWAPCSGEAATVTP